MVPCKWVKHWRHRLGSWWCCKSQIISISFFSLRLSPSTLVLYSLSRFLFFPFYVFLFTSPFPSLDEVGRVRYAAGISSARRCLDVIVTPPPTGERSIVMTVPVCLSALCVFVYSWAYLQNYTPKLQKVWCMLLLAVSRSSSGDVAACYVLPVLWMTSR